MARMLVPDDLCTRVLSARTLGVGVFETTNCRRTYEELRARVMIFKAAPAERRK